MIRYYKKTQELSRDFIVIIETLDSFAYAAFLKSTLYADYLWDELYVSTFTLSYN